MSGRQLQQIKEHLDKIGLDVDGQNLNQFMYRRTSQDYNPDWILQKAGTSALNFQNQIKDAKLPQYREVGQEAQDLQKTYQLLKNQTIGSKFNHIPNPLEDDTIDELQKTKLQLDKGTVLTKTFPFQKSTIEYPQNGMNIGNQLYDTSNMEIGKNIPTQSQVNQKYYPRDATFTKSSTANFKNNSLNTAWTFSKVHQKLNEF